MNEDSITELEKSLNAQLTALRLEIEHATKDRDALVEAFSALTDRLTDAMHERDRLAALLGAKP